MKVTICDVCGDRIADGCRGVIAVHAATHTTLRPFVASPARAGILELCPPCQSRVADALAPPPGVLPRDL